MLRFNLEECPSILAEFTDGEIVITVTAAGIRNLCNVLRVLEGNGKADHVHLSDLGILHEASLPLVIKFTGNP